MIAVATASDSRFLWIREAIIRDVLELRRRELPPPPGPRVSGRPIEDADRRGRKRRPPSAGGYRS